MENVESNFYGAEVGNPESDSFFDELGAPTQANVATNEQRIESYRHPKLPSQLINKHTAQPDLERQSQRQTFSQNGTEYLQENVEKMCGGDAISHEVSATRTTRQHRPIELQSQEDDSSQIGRRRSFQDNLAINSPSKEVYVNQEKLVKVMPVRHSRSNQKVEDVLFEWPLPAYNGLAEFVENLSPEEVQNIFDTMPGDVTFDSDENFEGRAFNPPSFVQKKMDTLAIANDDVRHGRTYTEAEAPKNTYLPVKTTITLEPPTIPDQTLGSRKRFLEAEESKAFTETTLYGKAMKTEALDGKSTNTEGPKASRQRAVTEHAEPATRHLSQTPIDIQPSSADPQPIACTPQIANRQLCLLHSENAGASSTMALQLNVPVTFLIINQGQMQQTLAPAPPQPTPNLFQNHPPNVRNPMNIPKCPPAHPYQSPSCSTSSAPRSTQNRRYLNPVHPMVAPALLPHYKALDSFQSIRPATKKNENDDVVDRVRSFSANPSFARRYYRILKPLADFGFKLIRQDRMKCMDPRCSMQHMIPGVLEKAAKNVQWHMEECRFFNGWKPCIHCAQLNGECRGCAKCI